MGGTCHPKIDVHRHQLHDIFSRASSSRTSAKPLQTPPTKILRSNALSLSGTRRVKESSGTVHIKWTTLKASSTTEAFSNFAPLSINNSIFLNCWVGPAILLRQANHLERTPNKMKPRVTINRTIKQTQARSILRHQTAATKQTEVWQDCSEKPKL